MPSELPPFATEWVKQWKDAAPRLQAIRDEELRRRGGQPKKTPVAEHRIYEKYPDQHGMVMMQRWFMRKLLLDCRRDLENAKHNG